MVPALVDPHRRPIGAEQTIRAEAEDIEAGGQTERRRQRRVEFVQQQANVALQLIAQPEAEHDERRDERVRDLDDLGAHVERGRRRVVADGEHTDPICAACQREQQRRARVEAACQIGHQPIAVGHEHGHAPLEGVVEQCGFGERRLPRIGAQFVETERRRRLQHAVAGVVLEQQRRRPAGHLDRMLMEMREQVARPGRVGQERHERRLRRAGAARRARGGRWAAGPPPGFSGHQARGSSQVRNERTVIVLRFAQPAPLAAGSTLRLTGTRAGS